SGSSGTRTTPSSSACIAGAITSIRRWRVPNVPSRGTACCCSSVSMISSRHWREPGCWSRRSRRNLASIPAPARASSPCAIRTGITSWSALSLTERAEGKSLQLETFGLVLADRYHVLTCPDDVVKHFEVEQGAGLDEPPGYPEVMRRRLAFAGRMVMDDDDLGRVQQQRVPEDDPCVHFDMVLSALSLDVDG